jgi:hypothetical protein
MRGLLLMPVAGVGTGPGAIYCTDFGYLLGYDLKIAGQIHINKPRANCILTPANSHSVPHGDFDELPAGVARLKSAIIEPAADLTPAPPCQHCLKVLCCITADVGTLVLSTNSDTFLSLTLCVASAG